MTRTNTDKNFIDICFFTFIYDPYTCSGFNYFFIRRVHWLVVDESDKLFEDGKTGFRDQVGMPHT